MTKTESPLTENPYASLPVCGLIPAPYGIRTRDRAGTACPAQDQIQDVVRLRQRLRRATEHQRLPGVPRSARRAARRERGSPAAHRADRLPAELYRPALCQVRSQKLFLSRRAQELPDHAIRQAFHGEW